MNRSLYQKYRPTTFKDIVGQSQVVSVLEKSVSKDSMAHAFLFTGSRGIGKTSIARIFAKELKCSDIDIFEIDAASHTSVEHMRELVNSVYTQPVESEYKVYILDEVHMLSKSAFNAFLKTLEEPPAYAVFVLVTTESDKIPETIVSRCVSLDFHQPSVALLQETAMNIAKKEGFTMKEQSAALIGMMAEGSFRDVLTFLQKVLLVSGSKKSIVHETVEEVLGAPRHEIVNKYLMALLNSDIKLGIDSLDELSSANANMLLFTKLCIRKIRAALLVRENVNDILEEYNKEDAEIIKELSGNKTLTTDTLRNLIDVSYEIPKSYIKKLPLEILLMDSTENTQ